MKRAKVPTDNEHKRLLAVVQQGRHAARNRMALMLSNDAGLRVGEIAGLAIGDVLMRPWRRRLPRDESLSQPAVKPDRDTSEIGPMLRDRSTILIAINFIKNRISTHVSRTGCGCRLRLDLVDP